MKHGCFALRKWRHYDWQKRPATRPSYQLSSPVVYQQETNRPQATDKFNATVESKNQVKGDHPKLAHQSFLSGLIEQRERQELLTSKSVAGKMVLEAVSTKMHQTGS